MIPLRFRLEPPELESEFRADGLAFDKQLVRGLGIVTIVFLILTLPVTLELALLPERLHQVWALRAAEVIATFVAILLVQRVQHPRGYDSVVTCWIGFWFAAIVAENALMSAGFTSFVSWDVFIAMAVYAALPLPLSRQVALALLLSAGDLLVLWNIKTPAPSFDVKDVALAYVCANVVGVYVSRERHGWRRRAFVALKQETAAKEAREAALREVKTLQGIIPICSYCKNIRTDAGDWQQVEAYVHAHSEAAFSHGVCPHCVAVHYPDEKI